MTPKVLILFWKDLLMRKNNPFVTSLEIIIPITLVILANVLFSKSPREEINNDSLTFDYFQDKQCAFKHSGHYGTIVYEPSTPFIDALMSKASCYAGYKKSNLKSAKLDENSTYFSIGVKFELSDNSSNIPDVLNYTLYPTNTLWAHLKTLWSFNGPAVPKYSTFTVRKVIEIQRAIDASYLSMKNITANKINLQNTERHPENFIFLLVIVYSAIFLELLFMLAPVLSRIIEEKYTGAKELMLMMGVRKIDIWVAKFLDAYAIQLINVTAMVIFFHVPLKKESAVLETNPLELWAIIMLGLIGTIIFLFFLSCFFQKSTIGVLIVGFFFVLTYLSNNYLFWSRDVPGYVLYISSLLPHLGLINGVLLCLYFDNYGKSVNFSEKILFKTGAPVLYEICLIMVLNIVIYGLLTWYFENVHPGKFGIPKPLNFFMTKSYWVRSKGNVSNRSSVPGNLEDGFEAVPSGLKVAVSVEKVSKVYKSIRGRTVAVDNVNLNFYKDEITALLGHNGAGKTTIFSMITGLTYPTSGKIFINGYDIETNTNKARQSFGLCPQHDMLFNSLDAIQTLTFYGMIKGMSLRKSKKEAMELIEKLKLKGSEKKKSSKLSGGQKRKVSLAVALIGGSQVLILDEPTSGMDPEIRREIWELLLKYRRERTILLTTHFMEEADALADRIAIMDHGKVKCYGTSMFLKSKYGKGYVLNIVLPNVDSEKKNNLIQFVQKSVPSSQIKSQNVRTITFELPENKVDLFSFLLSSLEKKQKDNEIISYSINVASLEEVFLSQKSGQDFDHVDSPRYTNLNLSEEPNLHRVRGFSFAWQQLWTLFVKKWIVYRKSFFSLLAFLLVPTALVVLVAFLNTDDNQHSSSEVDLSGTIRLVYSLNMYKPSEVLYTFDSGSDFGPAFQKYVERFGVKVEETPNIMQTIYETFKVDFFKYSRILNLGVEFSGDEINIYHNQKAVHMVPVSLNLIHNFLLNYSERNNSIVTSVDAKFANKDTYLSLPESTQKCTVAYLVDYGGVHSFFYLIGPVKEHFFGAKELQLMVTSPILYWLVHLIWDISSFFLYVVIVYIGMGFTQADDSMLEDPVEVLSGFLLWGIGLLLICYVISSFLRNLAGAFSVNAFLYVLFSVILYFFMDMQVIPEEFQYLHPNCIFKFGLKKLKLKGDRNFIVVLLIYDLIVFVFLILKDSKILSVVFHQLLTVLLGVKYAIPGETKEELVQQDENRVKVAMQGKISPDHVLVANKLKRWFFKKVVSKPAVRGVSFIVSKGECFGLLGINGAGKTTTFKMLTGELTPSHGKIFVCTKKLSILSRQKCLFAIGYCPQFGGLIPTFTGVEMLTFFARMRGIHHSNVKGQVHKWLSTLGLLEFAKKRCENYSGGNQRKLSTGISLIGDCPLIFLDEPTTGVDPLSRRSIWNLIAEVQENGQSIVLTSHSMDECEALCSRVAIMVKGKFRCIGETTLLKDKFGQGYSIRLKIKHDASAEAISSLKRALASRFRDCELVDEHATILQYKVSNKTTSAQVFQGLKDLKTNFKIVESYSASAATLEQIFIGFAREK